MKKIIILPIFIFSFIVKAQYIDRTNYNAPRGYGFYRMFSIDTGYYGHDAYTTDGFKTSKTKDDLYTPYDYTGTKVWASSRQTLHIRNGNWIAYVGEWDSVTNFQHYSFMQSDDGGKTIKRTPVPDPINILEYYDDGNMFVGIGKKIIWSDNGGQVWDTIFPSYGQNIDNRDLSLYYIKYFHNYRFGWLLINDRDANQLKILKTKDYSTTWYDTIFINPNWRFQMKHMFDTSNWIGGNREEIFKTTDGGKNWTRLALPDNQCSDFFFTDMNIGYCIATTQLTPGASNRIYKTIDGGKTWFEQWYPKPSNGKIAEFNDIYFANKDSGLIAGLYSGLLLYTNNGGGNNIGVAQPGKVFWLSTSNTLSIYPNPNTGVFNIKLDDEPNSSYLVSIYDVQGRLVYEQKHILSTNKEIAVVFSEQAAKGLYFVKATSDNRQFNGKLMLE